MQKERDSTFCERRLEQIIASMERLNFEEYLRYVNNRKRQFAVNFMAGLARGLGGAVGFSVLGAVIIVILQHLVSMNIPGIGNFLADVVRTVLDRI